MKIHRESLNRKNADYGTGNTHFSSYKKYTFANKYNLYYQFLKCGEK